MHRRVVQDENPTLATFATQEDLCKEKTLFLSTTSLSQQDT